MKIDIVNFARHADQRQLRWFVGQQLPQWIKTMLQGIKQGVPGTELINELAETCCVDETTPLLEEKAVAGAKESEARG
jgi:hypothetical protein